MKQQIATLLKPTTVRSESLFTPYSAAYRIAQYKRPHTVEEDLILPGDSGTIETTQIDEATDITKGAHLIMYVRFVD